MSLTLLAGMITPIYLKLVLDPKGAEKAMKDITTEEGTQMSFAMWYFILAGLILAETGLDSFQWELDSLLAWLGALIFLKGAMFLLAPSLTKNWMKKFKADHFPMFGFIGLLFALALVYIDIKVLA